MSLFDVEGWKLPKVAPAVSTDKSKDQKANKDKRDKKDKVKQNKSKKPKKLSPEELEQLIEQHLEGKPKAKAHGSERNEENSESTSDKKGAKEKSGHEMKQTSSTDDKSQKRKPINGPSGNGKEYNNEPKPFKKSKTNRGSVVDFALAELKPNRGSPAKPVAPKKLTPLQQKMMDKLSGSRFRWINEQLYTTTSDKALSLVQKNPELFDEYHKGYRNQVQSWPENPINALIEQFKKRIERSLNAPGGLSGDAATGVVTVADMGCGEAQLAADLEALTTKGKGGRTKAYIKSKRLSFKVHSFDLKKANDRITVADIKHVPLPDESVDVVVFCLSLMGTNFMDFITEAFRLLKPRGEVWIAEIKSRFQDQDGAQFVSKLKESGLFHKATDDSNKMFIRFEFFKPPSDILMERQKKQEARRDRAIKFIDEEDDSNKDQVILRPCIYKRR